MCIMGEAFSEHGSKATLYLLLLRCEAFWQKNMSQVVHLLFCSQLRRWRIGSEHPVTSDHEEIFVIEHRVSASFYSKIVQKM